MSESQRQAFEQRIAEDKQLAADVAAHTRAHKVLDAANQHVLKSRLAAIDAELDGNKKGNIRRLMPRLAIAASFLLIAAVAVTLLVRQPAGTTGDAVASADLATKYFAPTQVDQLRNKDNYSETYQATLSACDRYFEAGYYDEAVKGYSYHAGIDHMLNERAEWNLMISYMALEDGSYVPILEQIADDEGHMYHDQALKLQKELGR